MSRAPIRSVAILGGGITGLSAAAAFARALPGVVVTVIETPPDSAALADRLPGGTSAIHRFHAAIGLDEAMLVRSGAALPRLGLRFEGWGGEPWVHVHGEHGLPLGKIPFAALWARARREGRAEAYHRYAAAGVLAEAGRFVHPQPSQGPLATFDYALRLDPDAYRTVLARLCAALGVAIVPGALGTVERDPAAITALRLADGRRIEADLYIDASGPAAPLLADRAFEDWRGQLPFDRIAIETHPAEALDPCDTLTADATGWRWRAPLAGRVLAGSVGSGYVVLRPGRLATPWQGNALAIGDAAVALDPLHGLPLHLAQSSIARALDLLPDRGFSGVETAEYNRRAREEADCARDFAALHYHRWTGRGVPPGFARRGHFVSADEDSLPRDYWLAALLGLGVLPHALDPVAAAIDPDTAAAWIARIGDRLARLPAEVPDYAAYLG
jgi:tryptophan 7-halogenase